MLRKCYKTGQGSGGAPTRPRALACACAESLVRTRVHELQAGSWKLQAASCDQKEEEIMFYVVDQWDQYIREFEEREDAERFCERWNSKFRFSEWTAPKAHVVEG